jgi:hypothetical protein
MAVFAPANLPSSINTVERVFIWAAQLLSFLCATMTRPVYYNDEPARVCQVNVIRGQDNVLYYQVIGHIAINETELNSATAKTWMAAQDASSSSLPAVFTTV